MEKQSIRECIKPGFLLDLNATKIHGELTDIYRSGEASYRMVCYWIRRFGSGQET